MNYTSRSAIDCSNECRRRRYLRYFYEGRGITQKWGSIPLTTGTCVHTGVGFLLRNVMNGLITDVTPSGIDSWLDSAVSLALQEYTKIVGAEGFTNVAQSDNAWIFAQEQAKTEALVRAWSIAELPLLVQYFDIFSVGRSQ